MSISLRNSIIPVPDQKLNPSSISKQWNCIRFHRESQPISENSVLLSSKYLITDKRLTTIKFNKDDILTIIRNLNVNKDHGHNDTSIKNAKNLWFSGNWTLINFI